MLVTAVKKKNDLCPGTNNNGTGPGTPKSNRSEQNLIRKPNNNIS